MSTKEPAETLSTAGARRYNATNADDLMTENEKLRLENDDLRFEVNRLQSSVERQQQQIFELNRRLGERYDAMDEGVSDSEIDHLRMKEQLLNELLASRSWRLTRGYRFIGYTVQRFLAGSPKR
ncbi:hypothetical protein AB4097_15465 [Microvirga sp. 2MCAF35]|uniref:hypothetical protein n=1 Tax=Microvirga sp. 2MCAF35 TaxID=3232987 RepID=UPI003F975F06